MKKIKNLFSIISIFLLSACSELNEENSWIVGTSADNPPYEFMKNGKIVGFDVDVALAIGKILGKNIEFRNMEFHGLLAALASNNIDMVIAGMSITPERTEHITFSEPYTETNIAILFRKDDAIKEQSDLKDKKIGAQLGTTWAIIAHEMSVKFNFQTKSLSNNLILVEELKHKRLDAIILEDSQAKKFVCKYPQLSSILVKEYDSKFAIALPKATDLKEDIDKAIKELQSNGTIDELEKKWGINSAN